METEKFDKLTDFIRYCILKATNKAESGHPTSSLSAVELTTALLFGDIFRYNPGNREHPNNDRLIFSKGHASPLFYALWVAAGEISEEEMMTYRQFGSRLEGHPVMTFPYTEAATGSLGQGLSVGLGMALNAKYLDKLPYRTYVLLGDSEMAEGSQWEAIQIAAHYQLDNLIGILDVNRLGQRGETMYGHDLPAYQKRIAAFGWETIVVEDGHSTPQILNAYNKAFQVQGRPVMIIAKTIKGKGVPSVENTNGYHGAALGEKAMEEARQFWGELDTSVRGTIRKPEDLTPQTAAAPPAPTKKIPYGVGDKIATRDVYGPALQRLLPECPELIALDGEVNNSTRAGKFCDQYPDRYFEMYIAEQNMVGAAAGLSRRGKISFVSTFAAFLTRAFDQIRMSSYSESNIKFIGSHAGCSIGKDGPSQMGLEDIAMFRTVLNSVVLYPSDAMASEKLIRAAAQRRGIVYLRLTRAKTPVIYESTEEFEIGGSKTLRADDSDVATIVTAGYTLHEALTACDKLRSEGIAIRLIDLYSIKPLDQGTLEKAARDTGRIMVVEDHYPVGGMGEAVFAALRGHQIKLEHLAVATRPGSGTPDEVLHDQGLTCDDIAERVCNLINDSDKETVTCASWL
ncbi:MAG: transketolase [Verrucomicrobiota bacterium]